MPAANRHDETTPCDHSRPSLFGDDRGSPSGDRLRIGKHFYPHKSLSIPDEPFIVGFYQPPHGGNFPQTPEKVESSKFKVQSSRFNFEL
jgi:hypothetical protein